MAIQASTSPSPTSDIDRVLAKPTAPGKAPRLRLHNPADAYQIAATLVRAAIPRIERGRMINGLRDGNPPRSPAALRRQAQDWRANFNTLEAPALIGNAKTPYYDLFSATMPFVEPDLDTDDAARDQWNLIAAEEFHCFMYSYPSFEQVLWGMIDDFVTFNKGFFWWPDPIDPYFKRIPWWRVMFPNGSEMDPDDWDQFGIRQYWTVTRLWTVSGQGKYANWNGDAVVGAIQRATPLQPQSQQAEGIEIQQQLKDCDVLLSARSSIIRTVSIFTREYDGKWSWHMVEEDAAMQAADRAIDGASSDGGVNEEQPRFMFAAPRIFNNPGEILSTFIYEPGEGSINAFSGLGKQLFQLLRSKDIIEMGLLDGAILRQYPMLQPVDAASAQRAALVQSGPCHILSPGTQVIQTNLLADLEGSLAVMQHLERQIESNTAIFKPRMEKPQGNPETATAANLRFQQGTILTSSAVNRFYTQGDRWVAEVWRRATADLPDLDTPGIKAARLFQQRCKNRGVPLNVLRKRPYSINLTRAMGNGSPLARQQSIASMTPLVGEMGPRGRRAYYQMYTAAFAGNKAVDKLWPQADILGLPDTNTWMAEQENEYMHQGAEPTITDGQDNRVHARSHLAAVQAGLQAMQQGADPSLVLSFVPVALQHSSKHVAALPKDEQQPYVQAINQLFAQFQDLAKEAQRAQQQQRKNAQQAQQSMSDQQLAMLEIQLEAQRKDTKNQAQLQQRAQRHEQDIAQTSMKTAADLQEQSVRTQVDIANQTAKTAADIQNQRLKAEAQAEAARHKASNSPSE